MSYNCKHKYPPPLGLLPQDAREGVEGARVPPEARDCIPEINTSEIIVDVQWHFTTELHFSVAFSKGIPLSQWIPARIAQWTFSGIFQRNVTLCFLFSSFSGAWRQTAHWHVFLFAFGNSGFVSLSGTMDFVFSGVQ